MYIPQVVSGLGCVFTYLLGCAMGVSQTPLALFYWHRDSPLVKDYHASCLAVHVFLLEENNLAFTYWYGVRILIWSKVQPEKRSRPITNALSSILQTLPQSYRAVLMGNGSINLTKGKPSS